MSEQPLNFVPAYGIRHGGNVPFIMQTMSISNPNASPAAAVELQETIGDYCINFAYNLDPNSDVGAESEAPYWPPYGGNATAIQFLSSNVTTIQDTDRNAAMDFVISSGLYK